MATRRYKVSPGEHAGVVVSEAGAAVNSDLVEVTVELATNTVNIGGTTRQITRAEVLECLENIKLHILSNQWPPA